MLVLSRQRDETIMIGDEIEITVVDIRGDKVRLGITAPSKIAVHRKEVYEAIKRENEQASQQSTRLGHDLPTLRPAATNLVSNALAVQFVHRTLAYATAALVIATAATALRAPGVTVRVRRAAWMLVVAVGLQVTLGALTVISHVNPHVALAHQCNALLILLSALRLMHAAEGVPAATAP